MRADARRSRAAILAAAGELFAARGGDVGMDEIAERAGLGMGTLYRHFATKQGLLTAIVGQRLVGITEQARAAAQLPDPGHAFDTLLLGYLESAQGDAAFRYAILGPEQTRWDELAEQKAEFAAIAQRVIARAVDAGHVRGDLTLTDFVQVTRGAMANMHPSDDDWRRHVTLVVEGIRPPRT